MLLFPSLREVFVYFLLCVQPVLTYVPLIAIRFNAAIASFVRDPRFEASGEWGRSNGWSGIRRFGELDAVRRSRPIRRGACCNCRVLNLVSTRCVFFSSLSHCCCHDVPCAQNFSVEEIRVFQACLVQNPSVQVVCFENHAEWRFCLAPFCVSRTVGALAPCRRSRARLAQWRPSVLSLPLVFSVCTCALLLNIHLDSCDRTQAISFKQVISTAPPSTGL